MNKKFISTKLFKVIVILAVCGLLIFLNPDRIFNPVRKAAWEIFSPFQKIAYLVSLKFENTREFIFSIGSFKKENEELFKENQKLLSDNAELADMKRQNDLLKTQLDLLPRAKFDLETAYVIGQDPNGFGNWIEISKGSSDGISGGMPVIISDGIVVGKVEEVQPHSSEVTLITSPRSVINAMITESGTKGVIKGEYGLGILFDMILQTDTVNVGDEVITSGLSGSFPRGLYIGKVQDVKLSPDRLFQQATIISPVQYSKLEIVSVIKNIK